MKKIFSLSDPVLGKEEKAAICDVIDCGWVSMGERVAEFEEKFAKCHGFENAVAVSSCTAGMHLCLEAYNIGPGDEVLVPSLTFAATVNAVLYVKATPVFVDIEDGNNPHICIEDAKKKRSAKTKAIIVMHYGGYLISMEKWREFADSNKLILIEDAAHAPGMSIIGHLSDAAVFSFFSNKNMTTAEGGMVLTRDPDILTQIKKMRSHGMTNVTLDRYKGHAYSYDITRLGYNYRLDELRAAIGIVQLKRLAQWNECRRKLNLYYREVLSEGISEIDIPFDSDSDTTAHLMPVLLPDKSDRTTIMRILFEEGIQTSIHYPPVHGFTYLKERFHDVCLPNTELFFKRELSLPLHVSLTNSDIFAISNALKMVIKKTYKSEMGFSSYRL